MLSNAPPPPRPLDEKQIRDYLDYSSDTMRERRDLLISALSEALEHHAALPNDEAAAATGENLRMAAALARTIEERRKDAKAPFLAGGHVVDTWFKGFSDPLETAMAAVQARLDGYGRRKLSMAREEARKQLEAAKHAADLLTEQAAQALQEGQNAVTLMQAAAEAQRVADQAAKRVLGRAPELSRMRGTYGAAMSMAEHWSWRVADITLIPAEYLMVNPAAVKTAMKQRDDAGRPTAKIPGIEWEVSEGMRIR